MASGKRYDIRVGQRFGKVVVVGGGSGRIQCKCECGKLLVVNSTELMKARNYSCRECKDWKEVQSRIAKERKLARKLLSEEEYEQRRLEIQESWSEEERRRRWVGERSVWTPPRVTRGSRRR